MELTVPTRWWNVENLYWLPVSVYRIPMFKSPAENVSIMVLSSHYITARNKVNNDWLTELLPKWHSLFLPHFTKM